MKQIIPNELASLLLAHWQDNFAHTLLQQVIESNNLDTLYQLATQKIHTPLAKVEQDKLVFRAAYVLETLFVQYPQQFVPYVSRFYDDFPQTVNASAHRHFAKMMQIILACRHGACKWATGLIVPLATTEQMEHIAQAAADWASNPASKVAVKVNAIEVLIALWGVVPWIPEVLPDIIAPFTHRPSPGMAVRLRKWASQGLPIAPHQY